MTVTNGTIDGTTGPAIVNNSGSTGVTGSIVKGAWGIINSGKTLNLSGGSVIGTQNPAVTMISGTLNLKGGTLNEAGSTTTGLCIFPKTAADVTRTYTITLEP